MAYDFTSIDGLCHSDDASFITTYNSIFAKQQSARSQWVSQMRQLGALMIAPDDGWVDRENHTVLPSHYVDLSPGSKLVVGSLIALGGPDAWRVVRCTAIDPPILVDVKKYHFDPDPVYSGSSRN